MVNSIASAAFSQRDAAMELTRGLRAEITRALQAGQPPIEVARHFGITLVAVANIILLRFAK